MRVLITGANGLLGGKLVQLFSSKPGYSVLGTGRGSQRFSTQGDYQEMDISRTSDIHTVFKDFQPEAVINSAAMTNVDECELNKDECDLANIESVEILLGACRLYDTFFLQLSTDFIFDGSHGPLDEEEQPGPVNHYGESKLQAEILTSNSNIRWAIARTVLVYGVVENMSRSNIILWVRDKLLAKESIKVVADQWRTPTLAEDLAMGCFLIVDKKAEGVYNISGKDFLTPYDMANQTAAFFDLDPNLIEKVDSQTFTQPAKRPAKTGFVIEKAQTELGYQPHSFKEGIAIIAEQILTINK